MCLRDVCWCSQLLPCLGKEGYAILEYCVFSIDSWWSEGHCMFLIFEKTHSIVRVVENT